MSAQQWIVYDKALDGGAVSDKYLAIGFVRDRLAIGSPIAS